MQALSLVIHTEIYSTSHLEKQQTRVLAKGLLLVQFRVQSDLRGSSALGGTVTEHSTICTPYRSCRLLLGVTITMRMIRGYYVPRVKSCRQNHSSPNRKATAIITIPTAIMMKQSDYIAVDQKDEQDDRYPMKVVPVLPRRKNQNRSCCCTILWVVLALFVLSTLAIVAVGAGAWYFIAQNVERFSVTEGKELPVIVVPEAELRVTSDEANLFFDTLSAGLVPDKDLVVPTDYINGLFASCDMMKGNAFLESLDNKVSFDVSIPADYVPGGKGRFFVASGSTEFAPEESLITANLNTPSETIFLLQLLLQALPDQHYSLYLQAGEVMGQPTPPEVIAENHNLFDRLYEDPDVARVLHGISSITAEPGQIVIKARRGADEPTEVLVDSAEGKTKTPLLTHILHRLF